MILAGPYATLAGLDGFLQPRLHHHIWPSYGDFLNSFAMKAHAGPYGSYDKIPYKRNFNPHCLSLPSLQISTTNGYLSGKFEVLTGEC